MAEVSLSTLPAIAPPPPTGTTTAEGATEAVTPFANLLTALAAPPATPPALPADLVANVAEASMPTSLADPAPTSTDADSTAADTDADPSDPAEPNPVLAMLPPELSALLTLMAPPAPIVATPVRAPATPDIASSTPMPAAASAVQANPSEGDTPSGAAKPASPAQATIAPERMAQAFAAIRALATNASMQASVPPPPMTATAPATSAAPATTAAGAPAITTPAPSAPPLAPPATAAAMPQPAEPLPLAAMQVASAAQRLPDTSPTPTGMAVDGRTGPVSAPATATITAPEAPRATPLRARKAPDGIHLGEVRTDAALVRIDTASIAQATPAPITDDPVARQLSIAQDGQWLDSLAKDIASAGNANGRLNFRLDPDVLGSLTVQIAQGSDGASIRLTASSEAARSILADAQPRLVAEARAQGLNLRDATFETRPPAQAPAANANASFGGNTGGRNDQGGVAAQLQQQLQQGGGNRQQRAPDQPARANPAPRASTTRSGADLYA